jgi:hypothetical protein
MDRPALWGLSVARPTSWLAARGLRPSVIVRDPEAANLVGSVVVLHTSPGPGSSLDWAALAHICREAGIAMPGRDDLELEKGAMVGLAQVAAVLHKGGECYLVSLAQARPFERVWPGPWVGEYAQLWRPDELQARVVRREAQLLGWRPAPRRAA